MIKKTESIDNPLIIEYKDVFFETREAATSFFFFYWDMKNIMAMALHIKIK